MELIVRREKRSGTATVGRLFVNGKVFSYTLEDTVRPWGQKVHGQTAIPAGKYKVTIGWSNRFKRLMPRLENVPFFEGILIHNGVGVKNTEGCLLVGYATSNFTLSRSNEAFRDLYNLLAVTSKKGERITIEIINEPSWKIPGPPVKQASPTPVKKTLVVPIPPAKTDLEDPHQIEIPEIPIPVGKIQPTKFEAGKAVAGITFLNAIFQGFEAWWNKANPVIIALILVITILFGVVLWLWYDKKH